MDGDEGHMSVEQLLTLFVTRALGLTLRGVMRDVSAAPARRQPEDAGTEDGVVCGAWKTDRGEIKICATYDGRQSQRLDMHVLFIEWWTGNSAHHAGWWRSCRKRPGEWTRGFGSAPVPGSAACCEKEGCGARFDV
jgi:hypothetical protein